MSKRTCKACGLLLVRRDGEQLGDFRARGTCNRDCYYESRRRPAAVRFEERVDRSVHPQGCWLWTGAIMKPGPNDTGGYGQFARGAEAGHGMITAHRFAYEQANGPIPSDLVIDHLCRNRACVNPAHLEAVTVGTNTLRGAAPNSVRHRTGICKRGHRLVPNPAPSANGRNHCPTCKAAKQRERAARRRNHLEAG